jgi:outer membrane lipoprotein carrier protein
MPEKETNMKQIQRIMVAMASLLLVAATAVAGSPAASAKDVVTVLERGYGTLSDLQAEFSQKTALASLNREELGSGELFVKKAAGEAMFRFNYTKPRQQIISNGKTVWYYLPDNKQVMISKLSTVFEGGNGVALNYLTGMGHLSADFTAGLSEEGRDKKGNYVLDLIPRKKSPVMAKLRLTVSARVVADFLEDGTIREAFPVISSEVFDQLGNRTRIEFRKVRVNRGIGSDRFNFKVPDGVEIIKDR